MEEKSPKKPLYDLAEKFQEDVINDERTEAAMVCIGSEEIGDKTSRIGFIMGTGENIIRNLLIQMVRYKAIHDLFKAALEFYPSFEANYGEQIRNEKPLVEVHKEERIKDDYKGAQFSD